MQKLCTKDFLDKHFDTLGRELDALPFLCFFRVVARVFTFHCNEYKIRINSNKMFDSSIFQKFGTFLFFLQAPPLYTKCESFCLLKFIPSLFHAVLFPFQINDNVLFLNVYKGTLAINNDML